MSFEQPPPAPQSAPQPQKRSAVGLGIMIGVLVFSLVLVGIVGWGVLRDSDDGPVSGGNTPTADPSLPTTDPVLDRFYDQKIKWRACGRTFCGTLTVPLDYAKPDATTIKLAVLKVPAQGKRIGSLVVNPGGPGGSGVDFASAGSLQFGVPLSDRFDIVGFDPRGVASSDPLRCLDTAGLDRVLAFDPDPDDLAERNQLDALIHGFGEGCIKDSGELARHMSTKEVAKDMDVLRAALGESKLDYLGSSYGTFIGATYAEMFPDHVGRFVLDGAVDPALSNEQLALQQAGGFETALRAYVADCVNRGNCFLGDTVDAGVANIGAFLQARDSDPLPTSDSERPLTEGLALLGVFLPLYVKTYWPALTGALEQAMEDGRGTDLLALADTYSNRGSDGYEDNSMEALYAVNCLDHSDSIPTAQVPAHVAEFEKASPTFGRVFAYSLSTCENWPVKSGQVSTAIHAPGARRSS